MHSLCCTLHNLLQRVWHWPINLAVRCACLVNLLAQYLCSAVCALGRVHAVHVIRPRVCCACSAVQTLSIPCIYTLCALYDCVRAATG